MDFGELCSENVNQKSAKWRSRRQDNIKSGPWVRRVRTCEPDGIFLLRSIGGLLSH
jgi:hypothetical protein